MLSHNLLTTTSDDRSVKIWNLNFQETNNWNSCTFDSSKSMFGHTARIFRHKIIEYNGNPLVVSIGEDSNVCIWTRDGKLVCRTAVSEGSALWNLDYDPNTKYLMTCGSDGNINQISLKEIFEQEQHHYETLPIDLHSNEEFFSKIRILQKNNLLIGLTNQHNLYYRSVDTTTSQQWNSIGNQSKDRYKSALLEVHENFVATAGYQIATIYRWTNSQFDIVLNENLSNGMIRSLKFLGNNEFVICDDQGNCALCTIENGILNSRKTIQFILPACKERWITVALRHQNNLILSDRCGNLHLFVIDGNREEIVLRNTLKHIHGNLGCTCIYFESHATNVPHFKTAGHDGTLKTIFINQSNQSLEIKFTHQIPIAWSDKIIELNDNPSAQLIAGFNDNHFIVWQQHNNFKFEYECGGGHRYWDLYIDYSHSKCHLYFIRTKNIHRVQFNFNHMQQHPFNIIKSNWHTRPCNTVKCITLTNDRVLLISGGDDNLMKFTEINGFAMQQQQQHLPSHIADMILHISNVKTISTIVSSASNQLNAYNKKNRLIFSAGGRAQICVTELEIGQCNRIECHEVTNFMLRMNDLTRKRLGKAQIIDFDPETRFMSLNAYIDSNTVYLIVGCSDGYLRQFYYDKRSILLITSTFYGRCILSVYQFFFNKQNYLLTMATDGKICFWNLNRFKETSKPFFELSHHDSGINSFDVLLFDDENRLYVATGGDDQAIVISMLRITENSSLNNVEQPQVIIEKTVKFLYNHTAQVNGVQFSRNEMALYSVGVDQVIFRVDLTKFVIKKIAYTCISDAKGLKVIDGGKILVYGCGVQLLNISPLIN